MLSKLMIFLTQDQKFNLLQDFLLINTPQICLSTALLQRHKKLLLHTHIMNERFSLNIQPTLSNYQNLTVLNLNKLV